MKKRILLRIFFGIALIFLFELISGNLFQNVNAQISSIGSGTVAECVNCSTLNYSTGNSWNGWKQGTIYFNFAMYNQNAISPAFNWTMVPSNVYVVASGTGYSCDVQGVSNPRVLTDTYSQGSSTGSEYISQLMTARYSASCKVAPGSSGINSIHIVGLGNSGDAGIQLYGPITFTDDDDNSSVVGAINSGNQAIINNQNTNNQAVINNQNQNTQDTIKSQEVCNKEVIDKNDGITNGYLNSSGAISSASNYVVTDYINIEKVKSLVLKAQNTNATARFCFYNDSKTLISCDQPSNYSVDSEITIPTNSSYVRFSINTSSNIPSFYLEYCKNGNQALADSQKEINNSINSTNVDNANSEASSFFEDFEVDSHGGISGIITAPMRLIQAIYSSSCNSLVIPLPFVNENITIPCMSSIYTTYFGSFFTLYRLITTGMIGYWVVIKIFAWIRRLERPDDDRIEVLDL